MKSLALTAFAASLTLAATAGAQLAPAQLSTSTLNSATATSGTVSAQWTGLAGTSYAAYQALTSAQQAVELQGAIPASQANTATPETRVDFPVYAPTAATTLNGISTTPVTTAVRQSEACPTSLAFPIGSFTKTWSKSATYGNSAFGSGYATAMTFNATGAAGTVNDRVSAETTSKISVTVLNAHGLVESYAYARIQGTAASDNMSLKASGTTLWAHSGATTMSASPSWTRTLASASTLMWLGPVPVTLSSAAAGVIGVQASFGYTGGVLTMADRPWGNIKATTSTSTNVVVATTGTSSNLQLIDASFPALAVLKLTPALDGKSTFNYDLDLDVGVTPINGSVQLWSKVWHPFTARRWASTVANWVGTASTSAVTDVHGCAGKFSL